MKKNVIGRAGTAFALVGALALAGCSGSSAPSEDAVSSVLDPSDPVQVELWTYYNGTQQQAFEDLVKDFNATKGKDLGIVVTTWPPPSPIPRRSLWVRRRCPTRSCRIPIRRRS